MNWGSWSLSLPGVLKQLGAGISRENIFSFPQKHSPSVPSSAAVLPSTELTPEGLCPGAARWDAVRAQGPPSTASVLSPAMSQRPAKLPLRLLPPNFSLALSNPVPFSVIFV